MRSLNLSRTGLSLLLAAVLLGGVVLGSALPTFGENDPGPSSAEATPLASPSPEDLPMADVAGDDIERLPRFPGSVRSEFGVSMDERFRLTAAEFLAQASVDEVRAFYQGVIAEHGWQRADIGLTGGEWTYVLVDGATEALIEIELAGALVEIDLQISEPIQPPASDAAPTPAPATAPPPQQPAPPAPGDDDDDDGDDGGGDDSDDGGTDG